MEPDIKQLEPALVDSIDAAAINYNSGSGAEAAKIRLCQDLKLFYETGNSPVS
ncbi:MAG: hypothetical protein PHY09_18460 [Desulfuromonadaceae bacterium]|nr:hypothetical protein [Desulfuromonadaceae bacterium]MDD5107608.1 hypothetical protein [Desulfuromonadaceae bacterium]